MNGALASVETIPAKVENGTKFCSKNVVAISEIARLEFDAKELNFCLKKN